MKRELNQPFKKGDVVIPVYYVDGVLFGSEYDVPKQICVKDLNTCTNEDCYEEERECLSGRIGIVGTGDTYSIDEKKWCIAYKTKSGSKPNITWKVMLKREYERSSENPDFHRHVCIS